MDLEQILHSTFGFPAFRANQEAVCRAATEGRDVLLVMPTGAGKSLCYQLPALARGGTALVISPLIALMDDQASKLAALGLKVARIHSGLSRDQAREACRQYLDGTLQFLFIAPERMRVPGFPEMLARRKPSLIAIDEAHCISAWGHDFRPDYRTLGDYLPTLRPAPILALTATATPTVQKDIVAQLNLHNPSLFIHGFRRDNLAIEVVEMSKPRRPEFVTTLLADKSNRPAIVYAPSRKAAEELAGQLGRSAAPYHAGLDPATRDRVQTAFISGKLEVVVATIAFGMGIDKADVRTVVHIALPGSVEAYYQEIGRAGRDGLPSRTILLHSFVDRKMHDFFLERDYPPPTELLRVANLLTEDFQMPDLLRQRLKMDAESFDNAAQKLASQGAAVIDIEGNVRGTGSTSWRSGYDLQVAFRRGQIDRMAAFADTSQCRMTALIRHFGDTADATRPCGKCDICAPNAADFRPPNTEDLRQLAAILRALDARALSTGKLHTELSTGALRSTPAAKDRKAFDALLDTLTRAALITLTPETFTNPEGNVIPYKNAALTYEGHEALRTANLTPYDLQLRNVESASGGTKRVGASPVEATSGRSRPSKAALQQARDQRSASYTPAQQLLETRVREWRKAEAGKTGKPAFMVFGDTTLDDIVRSAPITISALAACCGMTLDRADRYGADICAICRDKPSSASQDPAWRPEAPPRPASASTERKEVTLAPKAIRHLKPVPIPAAATFTRPSNPIPEPTLTPTQQALDTRLRDWRKTESARLGLPQFFVLSSSTLRFLVIEHPKTLPELTRIPGIGPEKAARFGPDILQLCNA